MSPSAPFLIQPFPEWGHRVKAAFTTRYAPGGGASSGTYADANLGFRSGDDPGKVARNWGSALESAGLAGRLLVMPRMVHGTGMADADALPEPPESAPGGLRRLEPESADALFSRTGSGDGSRVLAVTMADCLTALIFDPGTGTIAAVHAGWRGTCAGILEKSLRALTAYGSLRAESALIAFGPCLRRGALEVGAEVAARLDPAYLLRRDGKFYFDMPACNRAQALACGLNPEHIRDMGGCTLTEPERYFSYRRDGQASGRLAAFISRARA